MVHKQQKNKGYAQTITGVSRRIICATEGDLRVTLIQGNSFGGLGARSADSKNVPKYDDAKARALLNLTLLSLSHKTGERKIDDIERGKIMLGGFQLTAGLACINSAKRKLERKKLHNTEILSRHV